jgi:uncharacterized repeat protein (TIGR02543 family)
VSYYERKRGNGGIMDTTLSVDAGTVAGAGGLPTVISQPTTSSILQTSKSQVNVDPTWTLHRFTFIPDTTTTATITFGNVYDTERGGDNDGVFLDMVSVQVTTYTMTYAGNGNTSGVAPVDANPYADSATVTVLGNTGALAKTGSTFAGWNTQADGLGMSYAAADPLTITADTTLYAKWECTVVFNSNGGSPVTSQTLNYNSTATQPEDPTRTNYTFAGWYSDVGLTTLFSFSTPITANTTLYAKWTEVGGGGYTDWASTNAPAPQTAGDDYDNDGVANGVEYFMGVAPGDLTFTANPTVVNTDGVKTVTWSMSATFSGSYVVQTSTNLQDEIVPGDGGWTAVDPQPIPAGGNLTCTLPEGVEGGKVFVRLVVTPD